MEKPFYEIFIDTGGTFTDLIAYDEEHFIYALVVRTPPFRFTWKGSVSAFTKCLKTLVCQKAIPSLPIILNLEALTFRMAFIQRRSILTMAGGTGAGEGFHGVSGLHQHMTNTRITDPEIMEHRYPVRIHRFQIRKNSGGRGAFNGGNGLIREYEFLGEVEVSLLTQHRVVKPYSMNGAEPGSKGKQWLIHPDGQIQKLAGITNFKAKKHDKLILQTPGGGDFGK